LASDDTNSNHTSGIEEVLLLDKWRRLGVRIRRKRAPSLRSTLKAMTLKAMAALQEEKELREAERHALKSLGVCSATAFWQTADPALVAEMDADALPAEREIAIEQGRLPPLGAALPLASGHAVDKSGGAFTTRQEELYAQQDVAAAGLQKDAKAGLELDHSSVAEDSSGDSSNDSSGDNSGDSSNDCSSDSSNGGGEDHAAIMEKDGDGDVEDKEVEDEGVDDDEAKDEEVEDEEPKYEEAMDRATPKEKAGDDQHQHECQRVHYVVQLVTSGLPLGDFTSDPGGEVRHWEWVPTMDVATVLERGGTSSPRAACVPLPVTVTPPSAQRFLSNEHMAIASVSPASMGAVSIKPCIKFSALAASVSTPSLPKHAQEAPLSKEADHLQQPVAIPKAPRPSRSLQTLKLKQRSRQKPMAVEGMLRRPLLLKRHSPHPLAAMSPELALDGGRHVPTMSAHLGTSCRRDQKLCGSSAIRSCVGSTDRSGTSIGRPQGPTRSDSPCQGFLPPAVSGLCSLLG
jgi:hypothetical protein